MQDTRRSPLLLWGIYLLLPAILLLDLRAPLGVAVGILYVVPLFGTRWSTGREHLLAVAAVGSVFTLVAPFFSPRQRHCGSISSTVSSLSPHCGAWCC